jgi:ATP-binding cassette subfamily F protein uup
VAVVSHDRYFLDRTVDRLFCFENGELQRFEGNYSAYLEASAARQAASKAAAPAVAPQGNRAPQAENPPQKTAPAGSVQARRRSFKETRELADLEGNLPLWEQKRRELEQALAAGGSDYTALEALTHELAELSDRIHAGEERWLALSELTG